MTISSKFLSNNIIFKQITSFTRYLDPSISMNVFCFMKRLVRWPVHEKESVSIDSNAREFIRFLARFYMRKTFREFRTTYLISIYFILLACKESMYKT